MAGGMVRGRSHDAIVVLGLTCLSGWLRWAGLGQSSYWFDDAWLALTSRADSIADLRLTGVTTPLFNHAIGCVVRLTGTRVLFGQAIPFVAGVAFAPFGFLALSRLGVTRAASAVAMTAAALAPAPILYATRVKPFTSEALVGCLLIVGGIYVAESGRRVRLLVVGAALAVLISASLALTAGPVLVIVTVRRLVLGGERDLTLIRDVAIGVALMGGYGLLYLRPTTPEALRDYWRPQMISNDSASAALSSFRSSLNDVVESLLPYGQVGFVTIVAVACLAVLRRPFESLVAGTPIAATAGASFLGLVPLGGGRTDIHLLASFAILLAFAVEGVAGWIQRRFESQLAAGGFIGVVAITTMVVGLAGHEAPWYPQQDLRPLVEIAEAYEQEATIVVYPSARMAYALYSRHDPEFIPEESSPTGYTIDIPHPSVFVLPPSLAQPERHRSRVVDAISNSDEVWFVGTFFQGDEGVILSAITDSGFVIAERIDTTNAFAVRFETDPIDNESVRDEG